MVMVFAAQIAVNPEGNPVAVPMPVAPVVAIVMGIIELPRQTFGFAEGVPAVTFWEIVMVSVAFVAHCPLVGVNV